MRAILIHNQDSYIIYIAESSNGKTMDFGSIICRFKSYLGRHYNKMKKYIKENAMTEKVEQMSLINKLAKIQEIADVVSKNKKGFNYKYADIIEILAKVKAGMKKYHVTLIPCIVPGTATVAQNVIVNTKFDKTGKQYDQTSTEMLVKADMSYKWINNDNADETIDVPWFVTGMQPDPSQAFGTGLSYCERYFLCAYFQIATTEDIDAYRSQQQEIEKAEDIAVAEGIIETLDELIKGYLGENPDKSEDVKKFIAKYVKNSNYLGIKEPKLAAKLLEDFKTQYLK